MALIVKNIPNKRPVKQVKNSGNPKPESREHMRRWTKWQNETIEKLKTEKNSRKREEHA